MREMFFRGERGYWKERDPATWRAFVRYVKLENGGVLW